MNDMITLIVYSLIGHILCRGQAHKQTIPIHISSMNEQTVNRMQLHTAVQYFTICDALPTYCKSIGLFISQGLGVLKHNNTLKLSGVSSIVSQIISRSQQMVTDPCILLYLNWLSYEALSRSYIFSNLRWSDSSGFGLFIFWGNGCGCGQVSRKATSRPQVQHNGCSLDKNKIHHCGLYLQYNTFLDVNAPEFKQVYLEVKIWFGLFKGSLLSSPLQIFQISQILFDLICLNLGG